ncbi:MAG: type III pantothenate kinase [Clostridiales bacterium]|nr:type III pantothenate kinase [Clostridiales bacterium]
MLLAIDMGNTAIKFGVFDGEILVFTARMLTVRGKTGDQYAAEIKQIFSLRGFDCADITDLVISSVVPELTEVICSGVEIIAGIKPVVVKPGLKTGINILIDRPSELGADLLVGAVAAATKYTLPCLVVDLGTANKISVVKKGNVYAGGIIAPGIDVSLSGLSLSASQLFSVSVNVPSKVIGTNTIDCMQSGIVFGTASMIDGMINRINEELGSNTFVVATGGYAEKIIPHCKTNIHCEKNLLLHGLKIIFDKNSSI